MDSNYFSTILGKNWIIKLGFCWMKVLCVGTVCHSFDTLCTCAIIIAVTELWVRDYKSWIIFKIIACNFLFYVELQSENARLALCEHPQWTPVVVILGLLQCSIPPVLKAELLETLTAFGKSPEIAASLWQSLEYTQVI